MGTSDLGGLEMNYPKRGEIVWVNLDPTVGSEIKKIRPCVIVSPDAANRSGSLVIVAPITKAEGKKIFYHEILLPKGTANFPHDSKIKVFQLRCIDKRRLQDKKMGFLSEELMAELNKIIKIVTGLY
ncbi:MAG: MazF family transcriptional regulator [Desulfobacca sp.]|nr:MazF family transcriptional regulator [Desulfobacca sp.]